MRTSIKQIHLLYAFILLTIVSCAKYDLSDKEQGSTENCTLRILTRSIEGTELQGNIYAYAFNSSGALIASKQITNAGSDFKLSLPQQSESRIVVIAADPERYDIPATPTLSSVITMKAPASSTLSKGYATSPIQMGFVDVTPKTSASTATVQLHYKVASLNVKLENLPDQCSSANITGASPTTGIAFNGTTSSTQSSRIPLTLVSGASVSGKTFATSSPVYIFPTIGNTTFTIAYNDSEGEQYASATYLASLEAGTPYQINGSYAEGSFLFSGTVTPSQWTSPVVLDFSFTNAGSTTINPGGTGNQEDITDYIEVTSIPQEFTVWNGHLVVATTPEESASGQSASLLLFSLNDWDNLTSALNTSTPDEATSIAQSYQEYDLSDWRIPNEGEARILSQAYRDNPDAFANLLTEAHASPVSLTDDKGNNLRYLCENATKTYSFKLNTITNAGATVKNYHLRLVRTIHVRCSK